MTSYFDNYNLLCSNAEVEEVVRIEEKVLEDMHIILSHKELPEENREEIEAILKENRIANDDGSPGPGRDWWDMSNSSQLLANLHSAFHQLGSCNITTTDGFRLTD